MAQAIPNMANDAVINGANSLYVMAKKIPQKASFIISYGISRQNQGMEAMSAHFSIRYGCYTMDLIRMPWWKVWTACADRRKQYGISQSL